MWTGHSWAWVYKLRYCRRYYTDMFLDSFYNYQQSHSLWQILEDCSIASELRGWKLWTRFWVSLRWPWVGPSLQPHSVGDLWQLDARLGMTLSILVYWTDECCKPERRAWMALVPWQVANATVLGLEWCERLHVSHGRTFSFRSQLALVNFAHVAI